MSETISFRDVKLEGGWLMVRPEREDLGKAMAIVRRHKDRLYDLEVKEHRKKRSLDANAYCWVLINKLADVMRIPPTEVYRQAILNIGGNYEVIPIKKEAAEQFKQVWQARGLGWPCCVHCGAAAPAPLAWSNAHFIARSQGGLGIPENGLTLCPECHRRYDQTTAREEMRGFFREYLQQKYPDWDETKLYYRKGMQL